MMINEARARTKTGLDNPWGTLEREPRDYGILERGYKKEKGDTSESEIDELRKKLNALNKTNQGTGVVGHVGTPSSADTTANAVGATSTGKEESFFSKASKFITDPLLKAGLGLFTLPGVPFLQGASGIGGFLGAPEPDDIKNIPQSAIKSISQSDLKNVKQKVKRPGNEKKSGNFDFKELMAKIKEMFGAKGTDQEIADKFNYKFLGKPQSSQKNIDDILGIGSSTRTTKSDEFFKALLENKSPSVFHNGGIVGRTGNIFAQRGEVIFPKGFKDGGFADGGFQSLSSAPLNERPMQFDTSKILKDLSNIQLKVDSKELKVEDKMIKVDSSALIKDLSNIQLKVDSKELKVEDKVLKVEDKTLKVEDKGLKIDVSNVPKLEVQQPDWKINVNEETTIKVEEPKFSIKVEEPKFSVKVDMPTGDIKVTVDVQSAASTLKEAISTALNQAIKVNVSGATNAVGGEKFDTLAQAVSTVKDQLIQVKTNLENKITLLGTNNQTSDIDRQVASIVDSKLTNVNQDINSLRNTVGDLVSSSRLKELTLDSRFNDLDYRLNTTLNITGVGGYRVT
jgi:hypothetical protein